MQSARRKAQRFAEEGEVQRFFALLRMTSELEAASMDEAALGAFWEEKLALAGVVLVGVDALGFLVLLLGEEGLVGLGEVAVVLGAHALLFLVDACFLMLKLGCFAGGKLAILDAGGDTLLLVDLALLNGLAGDGRLGGCGLSEDGRGGEDEGG